MRGLPVKDKRLNKHIPPGPEIRPLPDGVKAGTRFTCAAPDCDETFIAGADDETVDRAREGGRIVRVSTPDSVIDKWTWSAEHGDAYREAVREDHPDVDAERVLDDETDIET